MDGYKPHKFNHYYGPEPGITQPAPEPIKFSLSRLLRNPTKEEFLQQRKYLEYVDAEKARLLDEQLKDLPYLEDIPIYAPTSKRHLRDVLEQQFWYSFVVNLGVSNLALTTRYGINNYSRR